MSDKLSGGGLFHAAEAREQRNISRWDIDLTAGLSDYLIRSPGTVVYLDRVSTGYAAFELNSEQGGALDPLTMMAGDSIECPFQVLKLNAPAQPGKTLRVMVCIGVSVRGGSGISTGGTSIASVVSSRASYAAGSGQKTVTNADGLLLAANNSRNGLIVQNKDAAGSIYVTTGTGPATVAAGIVIPPGGYWEPATVPIDMLRAIGSIANNPNVVVMEGV